MNTYTVTISKRPLGARFGHLTSKQDSNLSVICVHEVTMNSHADKLGLAVGDILVAINKQSVSQLSSSEVLKLFTKQTLPFNVTFEMHFNSEEDIDESMSEEFEDDLIFSYINGSSTRTNTPRTTTTNSNKWKDFPSYEPNRDSVSSLSSYIEDESISEFSISNTDSFSYKPLHQISQRLLFPKNGSIKSFLPLINVNVQETDTNQRKLSDIYTPRPASASQSTVDLVNGFSRSFTCIQAIQILISKYLFNDTVQIDLRIGKMAQGSLNSAVVMLSSNGFSYGIHEWSIKIIQRDTFRQEIGVIEKINYAQDFVINSEGIGGMNGFGARAMYGNDSRLQQHYYASYNDNGKQRCKKKINRTDWCAGDVIKTILNLRVGNIQFFMNGVKVRKKCSIQKGKTYFPIIAFEGLCDYELINFSSS